MEERVTREPQHSARRCKVVCSVKGISEGVWRERRRRSLAFSSLGPDEFGARTLGGMDLDCSTWERQASETGPWPRGKGSRGGAQSVGLWSSFDKFSPHVPYFLSFPYSQSSHNLVWCSLWGRVDGGSLPGKGQWWGHKRRGQKNVSLSRDSRMYLGSAAWSNGGTSAVIWEAS